MGSLDEAIGRVLAGRCDCGGSLGERVHDRVHDESIAVCADCGHGWLVRSPHGGDRLVRKFYPHVVDAARVS